MFKNVPVSHTINYKHTKLTLETGLLAKQATASVLARHGETTVLASVVVGNPVNLDYLPLQIIYEERYYAGGKIKSSRFSKREGKPSDRAVLVGRMVDRSLRSLFDDSIRDDIQVVITVLSLDYIHPVDTLAVLAASSAVSLCGIEGFSGPVSSVRVGINFTPNKQKLITQVVKKINNSTQFQEVKKDLSEICSLVDLSQEADKNSFYDIFQSCSSKSDEWVESLKELYKSTPKKVLVGKGLTTNIQPEYMEIAESELDLVVSGNGKNIVMVEAGANIIPERVVGACLDSANQELAKLTDFQNIFLEKAKDEGFAKKTICNRKSKNPNALTYWRAYQRELTDIWYSSAKPEEKKQSLNEFKDFHISNVDKILTISSHLDLDNIEELKKICIELAEQSQNTSELITSIEYILTPMNTFDELKSFKSDLEQAYDIVIKEIFKKNILTYGKRFDGRKLNQTRELDIQVGVLPQNHGSSLFSRGETQVLNSITLGSLRDSLLTDFMEDPTENEVNYIHHYNFPSYSVGETGRYFGPGRREIGHGALAEKALIPVLPEIEDFPYTIRVVSECLGSNGSTSMASTCASSLSLMQAGVPISAPVAGVAMGLVIDSQTNDFKLITDIQGVEDHYGDMDFKVTGTKEGVTAIQLDNKVSGLTVEILKQALEDSRSARLYILEKMAQVISEPSLELALNAPRVSLLDISLAKIPELIGPGGKVIKSIIEKTGVEIEILEEKGKVMIYSKDSEKAEEAKALIKKILQEYKEGDVLEGKVFRIEKFGAFAKINDSDKEGLIHISELSDHLIDKVEDVVNLGQKVKVKIIHINERGQISLQLIKVL